MPPVTFCHSSKCMRHFKVTHDSCPSRSQLLWQLRLSLPWQQRWCCCGHDIYGLCIEVSITVLLWPLWYWLLRPAGFLYWFFMSHLAILPFSAWHCWLSFVACKVISEMNRPIMCQIWILNITISLRLAWGQTGLLGHCCVSSIDPYL